jgi:hypothetical protein
MGLGMSCYNPKSGSARPVSDEMTNNTPGSDCWRCRLLGGRCKSHRIIPHRLDLTPTPSSTPYTPYNSRLNGSFSAPASVAKFSIRPQGNPGPSTPAPPYLTLHDTGGVSRPGTMPTVSGTQSGTSFYYQKRASQGGKQVGFRPGT